MERKNPFVPFEQRPLPSPGSRPLEVCLLRGSAVESRHRVHASAWGPGGELQRWGDAGLLLFPRSSVKLMQALSWVAPGFHERWGLGSREMAIACGSHQGEPRHVELVGAWLQKLGLSAADLECAAHDPYDRESSRALIRAGQAPTVLHNNCSGKHAGLLTCCLGMGWPTLGYSNYDHPVQARLREILGEFWREAAESLAWGIDGCGIPTYSVSLEALARSMQLAADPSALSPELRRGVARLNQAITEESEYIGGAESFSSQIVAETEGRVLAKVGAEGVYGLWLPGPKIGIALKCEDGAMRAAEAAVAAILREMGHSLSSYSPLVRRWDGEIVGEFFCA